MRIPIQFDIKRQKQRKNKISWGFIIMFVCLVGYSRFQQLLRWTNEPEKQKSNLIYQFDNLKIWQLDIIRMKVNKLGLSWAKLSHSWGWDLDKLE